MTSNLGSDIISRNFEGKVDAELDRAIETTELEMKEMLRQTLKPEFLNRIDETVVFKPLGKADVKNIVKMQLNQLVSRLSKQDIKLSVSEETIDYLAEKGFDPQFGARPIKRVIQKNVLNELSKQLLAGKVERGKDIVLDIFDDQFVFRAPIKDSELAS